MVVQQQKCGCRNERISSKESKPLKVKKLESLTSNLIIAKAVLILVIMIVHFMFNAIELVVGKSLISLWMRSTISPPFVTAGLNAKGIRVLRWQSNERVALPVIHYPDQSFIIKRHLNLTSLRLMLVMDVREGWDE